MSKGTSDLLAHPGEKLPNNLRPLFLHSSVTRQPQPRQALARPAPLPGDNAPPARLLGVRAAAGRSRARWPPAPAAPRQLFKPPSHRLLCSVSYSEPPILAFSHPCFRKKLFHGHRISATCFSVILSPKVATGQEKALTFPSILPHQQGLLYMALLIPR